MLSEDMIALGESMNWIGRWVGMEDGLYSRM
jgi:hypothetical protein